MKNEWRSWKTSGDWLTYGQKRTLDNIGGLIGVIFFIGVYIWLQYS